jgi:hypothetical protein
LAEVFLSHICPQFAVKTLARKETKQLGPCVLGHGGGSGGTLGRGRWSKERGSSPQLGSWPESQAGTGLATAHGGTSGRRRLRAVLTKVAVRPEQCVMAQALGGPRVGVRGVRRPKK